MAQRVLQAIEDLRRQFGIEIVTPECQILVSLLVAGKLSTDQLCEVSCLSRSGFFHALDRLKHWKLVVCTADSLDRRRKVYSLAPDKISAVVKAYQRFRSAFVGRPVAADPTGSAGRPRGSELHLVVPSSPHFSCEFQIVLFLFVAPGATTGEIVRNVAASSARLHAAIARLVELKLITRQDSADDKRRKHYHLPLWVREALIESQSAVAAWVEDMDCRGDLSAREPIEAATPCLRKSGG